MNLTRRLAPVTALAALALSSTAAADSHAPRPVGPIPVPEGQVQHTVRNVQFEADYEIHGKVPWYSRIESWVARDRARTVTTDSRTGALKTECVESTRSLRCYHAEDNEIVVMEKDGSGEIYADSWEREAKLIRQQVDFGWFRVAGDTTFQDRPAKRLELTEAAPGESDRHDITAEPETLYPLKRIVSGSGPGGSYTQTDEVVLRETLESGAVDFRMDDHPGAKVTRPNPRPARPTRGTRSMSRASRRRAAKQRLKRQAAKRRAAQRRGRR